MTESKFVENVKKWIKLDDKVRELVLLIKELKEEKKDIEEEIIKYMQENSEDVINMNSGGTLRKSVSKTKCAIKHDYINQVLKQFTKSSDEANIITEAIIKSRPLKERIYLKRNAPRKPQV